jgi:hypothetical protein
MDYEDGYFGEQAAARYDESSADMFDPGAVEPVVEVLAGLAGGWAMRRVEELHDHRDRSGCRQDEVSRGGRLGEADIATREQGPQWRLRCGGHPRPPGPLRRSRRRFRIRLGLRAMLVWR